MSHYCLERVITLTGSNSRTFPKQHCSVPSRNLVTTVPVALRKHFDIVFVCGVYKSGTSLLTSMLSDLYFDPSRLTNAFEKGYGLTHKRYPTRECSLLRHINTALLATSLRSSPRPQAARRTLRFSTIGPKEYLSIWKCPIVVKDPRFVYTLGDWIAASLTLQKSICVCFTTRSISELRQAWDHAPYTRPLLANGSLGEMTTWLWQQLTLCRRLNILHTIHSLNQLRVLHALNTRTILVS